MKKCLNALYLFLFISVALAQSPELITNIPGRSIFSLNGNWQMIVDPYESGYYDYRYKPRQDGYFRNQKPQSKSDLIEYDFDTADILQVPGDWNTQREDLFFYEGTIWYKKSFEYKITPGKRLFVYFGAANYFTDVFLNGEKLGSHEGGFTPFNFEITSKVQEKDNFLIVKIDNKRRREGVPTWITDWWNYGGLTREVMLIEVPGTFIEDYFIQLQKGSVTQIKGWIRINGTKPVQKIDIKIAEAGINYDCTSDDQGVGLINFKAGLKLWSPQEPKLYDVLICSEADTIHDQIGFRSIEVSGNDILLNGKPVFLRGICLHEEAPIRGGRAWSEADALTALTWAKDLGCNFIRLAHYPHNEHIVRLADRMGIMLWEEIPVYWTIQWENETTLALAQQQLSEMITRDRNRAAVILWSMANETPPGEARLKFLQRLTEQARRLDPGRLITAAIESHYADKDIRMIDDPVGQFLDVLGCNEYIGWYEALPEKADLVEWKTIYDKPLIISEFGGEALYGLHGDEWTRWTEEYQENLYRHQINMLRKIPFLRGLTPWILTDFRSPRRPLPGIQDFWNRKGLISSRGEKKKAFYILRQYYNELQESFK